MSEQNTNYKSTEDSPSHQNPDLPIGIARLHEEWVKYGLKPRDESEKQHIGLEPVVFPEPVGDYTVHSEEARERLGLTEDAMDRLLAGGGLDSILVRTQGGVTRMISESALARFVDDSGMDPTISEALSSPVKEMATTIEALSQEVNEMRDFHTRQLQQFKDVLLLELRNLKEQDRDLTSFVYDLSVALEDVFPKLKKRKRTPPPDESHPGG